MKNVIVHRANVAAVKSVVAKRKKKKKRLNKWLWRKKGIRPLLQVLTGFKYLARLNVSFMKAFVTTNRGKSG